MAKIARVTQKIFAGNSATNQVTTFGSIKAGTPVYSKSASDIMNSNFEGGWTSAVEDDYAPYRQDRNAIDLTFSQQIAYILQEGCPEYDSGTTYYKNGIVKSVDGTNTKFFVSIANSNTSALTDTTKWKLFMTVSNTGDVTINARVPTQASGDNTTKAASTAFVTAAIAALDGAISSVKTSNLTASRALISNSSGKIAVSSITSTKLGYLSDVTSNIQAQINAKPSVSSVIGFPDYANATDLAKENGTIATDGYLYMRSTIYTQLIINGLQIDIGYATTQGGDLMIPVKAGDTYTSANWGSMGVFKHIPFRS